MANVERFERFHRVNATSGGVAMVSIHLRGVFALKQQAYEAIGEPEAVELFKQRDEWIMPPLQDLRTAHQLLPSSTSQKPYA